MKLNVDIEPPPEPVETAVPAPEPVKEDTAANTAAQVEIEDVPDEEEIPIEISNPSTSEAAGTNVRFVKLATIVKQKYSPPTMCIVQVPWCSCSELHGAPAGPPAGDARHPRVRVPPPPLHRQVQPELRPLASGQSGSGGNGAHPQPTGF